MTTRDYWVDTLLRIANPVYKALADDKLRERMLCEQSENSDRYKFTHLEALGRSLSGIGPWLNLRDCFGDELEKRDTLKGLVLRSLENATDPTANDFMNFSEGRQPIVDTAFLAQGLLRCWDSIWLKLNTTTQHNLINCMKSTRNRQKYNNNWLLFAGITESFILKATGECDEDRIELSLVKFKEWYKGDAVYGDGEYFRWDYYNSFVIQPFLFDILKQVADHRDDWKDFQKLVVLRLRRFSEIQERFIGPDGSFPPIGRSLTYRFGAFHALALSALESLLSDGLQPAAVRCALTAVIKRMIDAEGTFDDEGWLRLGFFGYQPSLAEHYISTGSLYICLCGMLPLGLPASNAFWSDPDQSWTSKKIWNGEDLKTDHALQD